MSESATLQRIRLDLGREPGLRLFRNNSGALKDVNGRIVSFGLHPGASDLIGWRTITITPEMVGQRIALFASVEVKAPGGTHPVTAAQRQWINAVEAAGGIAGVARSPEQARMALGLPVMVTV